MTDLPPLPEMTDHVLHMERVFDAPRDLVWRAWTRPEVTVLWLGPVEWPAVKVEQDLRVGGLWRACLKSAEGDDVLWQGGMYREVDPPRRLVFTFKWDESHEDGPPADTLVTVQFEDTDDGKTRMRFTHQGLKSERSLTGHEHGWTSTFGRFDAWLKDTHSGDDR